MRFDLDTTPRFIRALILTPIYAFAWLMAMAALAVLWLAAPFTVERERP